MPRRKKLDESPARAPGGGPAGGSVSSNTGSRQPQSFDSIMATHTLPSMSVKEQIVQNMQEMFANVDPDVIYMVLSECDFKVENAMDSLLELSVTVEPPVSPPVSGFEHTAAVLLNSQQSSQSHLDPGEPGNSSTKPDLLTEELDLLVDEELDLLAAQQDTNERPSGDTSSVHAPEGSQQALPEMVRSSLMSPPTAELWQKLSVEHLLTETPAEVKGSLAFAASGRPSAFQLYKKPDSSQSAPDNTTTMQPNITPQRQLYSQVFTPQHTSNPSFITPVVPPSRPPPWVNWAPVNPSPTASLPKSWALPAPPLDVAGSRRLRLEGKVLVLLRGAPGSGKSTLARAFKEHNPGAVILSTDDFFLHNGQYQFNPNALGEAHEWNHERAKEAFRGGVNPIIIDNTNTQGWEMKPYVALALKHNYKVHFREPDTWWKNKPRELERRSRHDVPVERIRRMLDNYEGFVSVHSIMGSALPETKQRLPVELVTADNKCPDLVGGFGRTHLSSSLPDVSSIRSTEEGTGEDKGHEFNIDSLQTDDPVVESVDSKVSLLPLGADEQIPDCIVESVVSEDLHGNEIPVAFCDSIKQRERRERPSRKSEFEKKDQSLKVQSEMNEGEKREVGKTEEQERALHFEGDWPTEGTLEQRTVRKRERQKEEGRSQDTLQGHTGPNFTEFQKLLDVIQTGEIQAYNTSEEGSSEEDPGSESQINPPESTEELAADTMEGNLDQAKVEFSGAAVVKLDSTDAARLSDAEVSTSVEGEGKNHSVVGEDEGGIAAQIDTNMSRSKEDVNSATGCGNDACEETGVGGQGRKQRRRSGKQCKLAPNFPPDHSLEPLQGPNTKDLCENSESFEITATKVPDEHSEQQHCPPRIDGGCVTQTEPQDFALLWRLDHRNSSDKTLDTVSSFSNGFKVMEGSSSRFVPESSSRVHVEVPYHVVHEKGTQVEENDFGSFQDRPESLRILSRHFKLVTFDTLEDLYDKCHQDLEWTTNLLLDSGEKFFKEEEPVEMKCVFGVTNNQISTLIKSEDLLTETNTGSAEDVDAMEPPTEISEDVGLICSGVGKPQLSDPDSQLYSDNKTFEEEPGQAEKPDIAHVLQTFENDIDDEACVGNSSRDKDVDTQSMDEIHRLLQAELDVIETAEKQKSCDKHPAGERRSQHVDIRCVEMTLPTEVALQLTELFGPVGVDPDTCSTDEYTVQLDLNLAKRLHQQWKDTIQDRHRQAALSFHLLQENKAPKMDHWCAPHQPVSLRDIIKEEQALQRNVEKSRQDRSDIDKRDGATLLKENQLFAKFPTIDRHFLQDIFRDHNYSLAHTEMFLHSLLDDAPAKTVVAPVTPRPDHQRAASRERDKQNPPESKVAEYQDTEEPQYEDFRAEARLQRRRQLESFTKAAEAFKQGRKEVASFYAQQGHLHGQSMREANYRAAIQIFEKVNSSLLPQNILDLHGLHVEEALQHLDRVLQAKTKEYEQGLGRPQLSVITGKGNHSQGGVARIRPAVIDYLNNRHYRFTEPNPGLVLVSLK